MMQVRPVPRSTLPLSNTDAASISVLRWHHEEAVAALLARAFLDDPLVAAICDVPAAERQERMHWSFRIAVRSHCLGRQPAWVELDEGGVPRSVVLTTRSQVAVQPHSDILFTLRALRHVGLRIALRGVTAAQQILSHAPQEPFTYLRTLGVDPDHQRCGMGSRLVQQVLRAASPLLPVYLETAKQENLAFYARHGFVPAGDFECLGVRVWRLLRPSDTDK